MGQADRELAREYGIALRPDITVRVARHLRRQDVLGAIVTALVVLLLTLLVPGQTDASNPEGRAGLFFVSLAAFPLLMICSGLALGYPAWNRARARRVTHFLRPTPGQIFTSREQLVLGMGFLTTAAAGCWGLWLVAAEQWWPVWLATFAASVIVTWWAARLVLARPAQASDDGELAWDDLLRHKAARELIVGAAWIPAIAAFLLDWILTGTGNLLPSYAACGVGIALTQAFKPGRQLWRQSWGDLDPT